MNAEDRKSLGRQLKEKRKGKYSQQEFAEMLEISRQQLSSYENGHVEPPFQVLLKAAEALDCEFVVAGYRLTRERLRPPQPAGTVTEKQLTFRFYKDRVPGDATLRVTTLRKTIVIHASVRASPGQRGYG
jgi:transcriptional regulator with XRE-family HTH domain